MEDVTSCFHGSMKSTSCLGSEKPHWWDGSLTEMTDSKSVTAKVTNGLELDTGNWEQK